MKKLLTTITLSALVGTSAGNLKPMFAEKIVNTGFKSNQLNKEISNRSKNDNPFISKVNNLAGIIFNSPNGDIYLGALDGLYKSTDYISTKDLSIYKKRESDTSFTKVIGNPDNRQFEFLIIAPDNVIYAGTNNGLYKSTDGNTFTKINEFDGEDISSISINDDGSIYVAIHKGLYITNPVNLLLKITKPDTFDKSWPLYNGFVYKNEQKIDIKEKFIVSAKLDGKSITVPTVVGPNYWTTFILFF